MDVNYFLNVGVIYYLRISSYSFFRKIFCQLYEFIIKVFSYRFTGHLYILPQVGVINSLFTFIFDFTLSRRVVYPILILTVIVPTVHTPRLKSKYIPTIFKYSLC